MPRTPGIVSANPDARCKHTLVRFAFVAALVAGCGGPAASTPAAPPRSSPSASAQAAPEPTPTPASTSPGGPPPATTPPTQALIDFLVDRVTADPDDGDAQLELGYALLQRIRETGDPSLYGVAERAFDAARRLLPGDPRPLVGIGGLQLGRHEFEAALDSGEAALELDASDSSASAVIVDALIELGRYEEAFPAVEDLVRTSVDLTTLARLSYARELQGDLDGALAAMREAADSPSVAAENTAFALSLVGQLERLNGDAAAARAAYEAALDLAPDYAPALAGLGRLAVGDGDLDGAIGYFERAAGILPLAEYVIALGETLEAAGDTVGARRQYELARAQLTLFEASGVIVDVEFALFEADHGDAGPALRLAEAAYGATPTVRAADALAWALHRSGRDDEAWERSQEALRLGSRDPLLQFHAGVIAAALGDGVAARDHLEAALATDPGFSATGARAAQAVLDGLSLHP